MIVGLPGPGGFAQGLSLPANLDLALGKLRQERTTTAFADKLVDLGNQIDRKDYVRSAAQALRHTPSVT